MSYGSTAYGSAALGGSAAGEWYWFFPYMHRDSGVLLESRAVIQIEEAFFSVITAITAEIGVEFKIYTANDEGETPQLQATLGGIGQAVVASARFITVTAFVDPATWPTGQLYSVRGRPGD